MCYSIFIINSFYDWCSKKLMSWIRSETLLWPSSRSTQSASYRRFIFSPNIHYQSHQMFQYLRHRTSLRLLSNIISETHILGKLKGSSFVWEKMKGFFIWQEILEDGDSISRSILWCTCLWYIHLIILMHINDWRCFRSIIIKKSFIYTLVNNILITGTF